MPHDDEDDDAKIDERAASARYYMARYVCYVSYISGRRDARTRWRDVARR